MMKTCCVTGHREIAPISVAHVKDALKREVEEAVKDGYGHFISGFAEGVDLWFAEIVVGLKLEYPYLTLEAALPYRNRIQRLMDNGQTKALITQCSLVGVHCEGYSPGCFMKRNRYMVAMSSRVIAVFDGRPGGGTLSTMREAKLTKKEMRLIMI